MRIKKYTFDEAWLIFVVLIFTDFFHLVPLSTNLGIDKNDAVLISVILWICVKTIQYKSLPINGKFKIWALFTCALVVIASVVPYVLFKQSIYLGFRAQRVLLVIPLTYFELRRSFQNNTLHIENVLCILKNLATIELLIMLAQCLLQNYHFTNLVISSDIRGDLVGNRLRDDLIIVTVGIVCWLDNILNGQAFIKSVILLFLSLFVLIYYVRTRMLIVGVLVIVILASMFWKPKNRRNKYILVFLLSLMLVYSIYNIPFFRFTLLSMFGKISDANVTVRLSGQNYYFDLLRERPLFGYGLPHESCPSALWNAGIYNNILLADNGIIAFSYVYGIVGALWILYFWLKNIKASFSILRKKKVYLFFLYFSLQIVICFSLAYFWAYAMCFLLQIFFAAYLETD